MSITIGIIGGSGLYDMAELTDREERRIDTPFGEPSAPYVIGTLRGKRVAFLARHGIGHRLMPSELNFRANIFGFKTLGVEYLLSASAVGSLKEEYKPLDLVIPDQFVDRTRGRISTFFGRGLVAHVGFAHPFCAPLSEIAYAAARAASATVHKGGAYVCMEGPQFSTLAESRLYRSWGMDIIGMTNLQEAKLAREAEICYTTIALVTDYDAGLEGRLLGTDESPDESGAARSTWVVLAQTPGALGQLAGGEGWTPLDPPTGTGVWTDDFHDLLRAFKWR